ncbi:MAG: hypothetical protein EP312_10410 [Gammaproteobacteria bacterium]|nr:MAG: hypothetical protein EP312_10410 [Gammaproteobacteria bacterium]
MATINDYFKYAQVAQAAYSDLQGDEGDDDKLFDDAKANFSESQFDNFYGAEDGQFEFLKSSDQVSIGADSGF